MFSYIDWYVSVSSLAIYHWFPFFAHFDVIAFEFDVGSTPRRLIIDFSRVKLIKIQLKPNISVDSNALKSHSVKNWNFAGKISLRWKNSASTTSTEILRNAGEALKVKGESTTHSSNVFSEEWKHWLRRRYIYKEPFYYCSSRTFDCQTMYDSAACELIYLRFVFLLCFFFVHLNCIIALHK